MELRKGHTLGPQPMGISDTQLGRVVGASMLEAMLVVDVVEEPGPVAAPDVLAVVVVVGVVVAEVAEVAMELRLLTRAVAWCLLDLLQPVRRLSSSTLQSWW